MHATDTAILMVDMRTRDLVRETHLAHKNRQVGASRRIANGSDGRDRRDRHLAETALSATLRAMFVSSHRTRLSTRKKYLSALLEC